MTLDRFQKAWKAEAAQVKVTFDTELLAQKVKQSQATFRSIILLRDIREVGLALVMIPVWFAMGIAFALPWTWYLTVPVLLWSAGFMLVYRLLHPEARTDAGEALSHYVQESLDQIEHQIWLLSNVFWWSLLPFSVSLLAFFVQVGWDSVGNWWGAVITAAMGGTFVFYLYRWIYRLNQRVVREQLGPKRDKLRNLMSNIESGSSVQDLDELLEHIPAWTEAVDNEYSPSNGAVWAENWNRIIPSWREVAIILVPTLLGAFCGWQLGVPDIGTLHLGPAFFQTVVAAVVPFEIAFFSLWYRSSKRHRGQAASSATTTRPRAPAMFTLAMSFVMFLLAVAALIAFGVDQRSRRDAQLRDVIPPTSERR